MLIEEGRDNGMLRLVYCLTRLDAAQAKAFRDQLERRVARGEKEILLDLSRVVFVDSAGLGALIALAKKVEGQGRFEMTGLNPQVTHLLALTRMNEVLRVREGA